MKSFDFWNATACSPLNVNPCFGGIFRLHVQGRVMSQAGNEHETDKSVISQKTKLFRP
jgi:hypothetical protein